MAVTEMNRRWRLRRRQYRDDRRIQALDNTRRQQVAPCARVRDEAFVREPGMGATRTNVAGRGETRTALLQGFRPARGGPGRTPPAQLWESTDQEVGGLSPFGRASDQGCDQQKRGSRARFVPSRRRDLPDSGSLSGSGSALLRSRSLRTVRAAPTAHGPSKPCWRVRRCVALGRCWCAVPAVGVYQAGRDDIVQVGVCIRQDRLVAYRLADDGEPPLPFV
jgi:hypothetical protein